MVKHRTVQLYGWSTVLLTALMAKSAVAQVAVRPWFVGGGTYGGGLVDDFLDDVAGVVREEASPVRQAAPQRADQPGQKPAAQRRAQSAATAAKGAPSPASAGDVRESYSENPRKWGQVFLHMRQGEESFGIQERPRLLTSGEVDPVTGNIHWPQLFLDKKYDDPRRHVERLFALRASTRPTPEIATRIHDRIVEMIEMLRTDIEELPANDFVAGRKFLDSLDYLIVAPSVPRPRQ